MTKAAAYLEANPHVKRVWVDAGGNYCQFETYGATLKSREEILTPAAEPVKQEKPKGKAKKVIDGTE